MLEFKLLHFSYHKRDDCALFLVCLRRVCGSKMVLQEETPSASNKPNRRSTRLTSTSFTGRLSSIEVMEDKQSFALTCTSHNSRRSAKENDWLPVSVTLTTTAGSSWNRSLLVMIPSSVRRVTEEQGKVDAQNRREQMTTDDLHFVFIRQSEACLKCHYGHLGRLHLAVSHI